MKNCKAKRLQKTATGVVNIVGMSGRADRPSGQYGRNVSIYYRSGVVNIVGMIPTFCANAGGQHRRNEVVSIVGMGGQHA